MEQDKDLRLIHASALAAASSIFVVTAVTIIAELSAPFKDGLKSFTGHHWVTKSWLSVIVFALAFLAIYAFTKKPKTSRVRHALQLLLAFLIGGTLILLGFFVFEFYAR